MSARARVCTCTSENDNFAPSQFVYFSIFTAEEKREIIANAEAIAIDQDTLSVAGDRIYNSSSGAQVKAQRILERGFLLKKYVEERKKIVRRVLKGVETDLRRLKVVIDLQWHEQ